MSRQSPTKTSGLFNFARKKRTPSTSKIDVIFPEARPHVTLGDQLDIIRHELRESYSRPDASTKTPHAPFITLPAIQKVINRARLAEIFSHYDWYSPGDEQEIFKRCLRVVAILIVISWPEWKQFKRLILDVKDQSGPLHSDRRLPFSRERLRFLEPTSSQLAFEDEQYTFCPLIIQQDSDRVYSERVILPFTRTIEERDGGFGQVLKQEVEKYQIQFIIPPPSRETYYSTKV